MVLILEAGSAPVYLEIGEKAAHLRALGRSDRAIASALGVSDKTVAKSLRHYPAGQAPAGADRRALMTAAAWT